MIHQCYIPQKFLLELFLNCQLKTLEIPLKKMLLKTVDFCLNEVYLC